MVFYEDIFPFKVGTSLPSHDCFNLDQSAVVSILSLDLGTSPVVVSDTLSSDSITPTVVTVPSNTPAVSDLKSIIGEDKRSSKTPSYLQDYYCNLTIVDIPYPLSSYMSYAKISDEYKAYICALTQHPEPTCFAQAKKFDEWIQVMNEELIALENNHTWLICSLPPDKHVIGCKWVHKIKMLFDGTLEHYKARLVAKG